MTQINVYLFVTLFRMQVNIDPFEEQSGAQYTIKRLMDDIGNILKP